MDKMSSRVNIGGLPFAYTDAKSSGDSEDEAGRSQVRRPG